MAGGHGGRHLHHAGIERAGIGVDPGERVELDGKLRAAHRIGIGIEAGIGALGRIGHCAAARAHGKARGFGGAFERAFGDFGGMGVARDLALDGAQAEPFGGVVAGGLDPPVIEQEHFGAAAFEEQFAILGPVRRRAEDGKRRALVEMGVEGAEGGLVGHRTSGCGDDLLRV